MSIAATRSSYTGDAALALDAIHERHRAAAERWKLDRPEPDGELLVGGDKPDLGPSDVARRHDEVDRAPQGVLDLAARRGRLAATSSLSGASSPTWSAMTSALPAAEARTVSSITAAGKPAIRTRDGAEPECDRRHAPNQGAAGIERHLFDP
jgi:hypothetical protein